jgi:hypothetical protein
MTKNIDKLIQFLRDETIAFSMAYWFEKYNSQSEQYEFYCEEIGKHEYEKFNTCGTAACIGGSASFLMAESGVLDNTVAEAGDLETYSEIFKWIVDGVPNDPYSKYEPVELFEPEHDEADYSAFPRPGNNSFIERAKAIRVLEHLRDTGEIDWSL